MNSVKEKKKQLSSANKQKICELVKKEKKIKLRNFHSQNTQVNS